MNCRLNIFVALLICSTSFIDTISSLPSLPSLNIVSSSLPPRVGGNISFKCKASGSKDFFWFKDGKRLGESKRIKWVSAKTITSFPLVVQGKLKIMNLRKSDRGIYTCYALNFFTNIMESVDIRLIVHGKHNVAAAKHIRKTLTLN
ncbi:contactin-5-like [Dendronephthya gigantea]|uniref:contactin-5-like n=1 Tax=Dendronephthya gigantea TaxID=151771 RepID=UPI00106BA690|nr:contactin-5-like [Dendronephthya gigantea]XP_028409061.1 contactin-5-like [Dendronephthya gigantea]